MLPKICDTIWPSYLYQTNLAVRHDTDLITPGCVHVHVRERLYMYMRIIHVYVHVHYMHVAVFINLGWPSHASIYVNAWAFVKRRQGPMHKLARTCTGPMPTGCEPQVHVCMHSHTDSINYLELNSFALSQLSVIPKKIWCVIYNVHMWKCGVCVSINGQPIVDIK